jgi:hypothetical protein
MMSAATKHGGLALPADVRTARLPKSRVIGLERALGPKRRRQCLELGLDESVGLFAQRVINPRALATRFDNPGTTQDAELTRHVWLTQVERLLQMADAQLPVREQRDNAQARFVAERAEQQCQRPNIQIRSAREHPC